MEELLGIVPVIISIALIVVGTIVTAFIKNPYLRALVGFMFIAVGAAVLLYFICESVLGVILPLSVLHSLSLALSS